MNRFCACVWAATLCLLFFLNVVNSQTVTIREINPTHSSPAADSSGGRVNHLGRATNSILYAATEYGGLFKSADAGRTWARLDSHLPTRVLDVKASPADPNFVIATSLYDGRVNSLAGINVSHDGGANWVKPNANPPANFCSNSDFLSEPSALGIAFDPVNAARVFVGTRCGLARSTDGGVNWTFLNPFGRPFDTFFDRSVVAVLVHHGGIIDVCGFGGHRRSLDGGTTWNGPLSGGTPLPGGVCSIAASPDESSVIFITVGTRIFESDNGGGSWDTEFVNPRAQGHVPYVATNNRQGRNFDLWFGDVGVYRAACTTPLTPGPGARCPASSTWTFAGSGAHADMGEIVFTDPPRINVTACRQGCSATNTECQSECDAELDDCMKKVHQPGGGGPLASQCTHALQVCNTACTSNLNTCNSNCSKPREGCPLAIATDGGTFINALTESPACQTPKWVESDVTPRALWLWSLSGANIPNSRIREALYMGAQDNGTFATLDAGSASPNWTHTENGDSFDDASDSTQVVYTNCCYGSPRDNMVFRRNPGMIGGGQIPNYPPGTVPRFLFPDVIARFGVNRFALVMTSGIFATQNITATPIAWTSLGTNAPTNACGLWSAGPQTNPTFFAVTGFCSGFAGGLLRYNGTSLTGTWQTVPLPPSTSGVGVFAVDPNNPGRLFVSAFDNIGVHMFRTINGGATWVPDTVLDALMTGSDAFRMTVISTAPAYTQPTMVAFDPNNSSNLLAGAADAGIFLSRDNGATWVTLTNNAGNIANPIIPRPHWAYFNRECGDYNIYVGTQGRGAWRFSYHDSGGPTITACQARCDTALSECQRDCLTNFEECMNETGPGKHLPFQCAAAREQCKSRCGVTRNSCRQGCVDCPH